MDKQSLIDAWIKENQVNSWEVHDKCYKCGYPHSSVLLCGWGAYFGTAIFGGDRYGVDSSNVDYYVSLRMSVAKGHHWKNDTFFYVDDDCVVIRNFVNFNGHPNIKELKIPISEWETIIDQVDLMYNKSGEPK